MLHSILQIRQTPALIGMDSERGTFSITQPNPEVKLSTTPAELTIQSSHSELTIDQTQARAAYNGGSMFDLNKRIYSGIQQLYLQGIAKKVEQGNRMAEFFRPGNTIAEVYGTDTEPNSFPEILGPASYDNVDFHFEMSAPQIYFKAATLDIQVEINHPEIEYHRGKLNIYMQQYASVSFIPPEVNLQM